MPAKKPTKKEKRIKPTLAGGFRDYGPAEAIAKQKILDTVRATFERFGFDPIETSSVQRTEVLTGGEKESQKIIFNLKGSQDKSARGRSASGEKSDTSLRFDLTVPLARFIAANPDIPKPFKRYQIGQVFRGERQQAGRFREFTQADIDIVGTDSANADAEVVMIIYTVLKNLGMNDFIIRINDRALLEALPEYAKFPKSKLWDALRIIDKKDKIGETGVTKELQKEFGPESAQRIEQFISSKTQISERLETIKNTLESEAIEKKYWEFDRSLVRGLSYYTGPVFETILTRAPEIGSIFGGGRYDDLVTTFTGQKISAVGVSFGVDRYIAALEKLGAKSISPTMTKVLILNLTEDLLPEYLSIARTLRAANINTALYSGDDRTFQAQLSYAVKKGIPYVLIYGDNEKKKNIVAIKNLATREQSEILKEKIVEYFR